MENSSARGAVTSSSSGAPPPHRGAVDSNASPTASLENSLNRRRNTYTTLPGLAPSKPLSTEVLGSAGQTCYTNADRRNTTSGIDWHTPPVSTTTSIDRNGLPAHASSEPRHTTASRLPLKTAGLSSALPLVTGSGSGGGGGSAAATPPSLSARAVSASLVRPNAAITRSARLPLGSGISPSGSAASTPPARRPPLNWAGGVGPGSSNNTGGASTAAAGGGGGASLATTPTPPSGPLSATTTGKSTVSMGRVDLTNSGTGKRADQSPVSTPSTTSSPTTTTGRSSETPPEVKTINTALKTFNQRVLEEREREKARLSRRSSRANSRETSMSALAVPSTQPPSAGPPPSLKATTAPPPPPAPRPTVKTVASAEPAVKRGPFDSTALSGTSCNARTPANLPAGSVLSSAVSKSPAGTGPKTTPVAPPPPTVPSTLVAKSPAGPASSTPPRQLSLTAGRPNVPLTVSSSSSGSSSNGSGNVNHSNGNGGTSNGNFKHVTPHVSRNASLPRSTQNSTDSGMVGNAPRTSLVEQGPRSNLPRTLPASSNASSAQPTPVKAPHQTTSPAAAAPIKAAKTPTTTPPTASTSGSQSVRLELQRAPFSQSPPQLPSVRHSGNGTNTTVDISPRTPSTNGSATLATRVGGGGSLPSRYSDCSDDRSLTPPRAAPLPQAPISPVYSAVEVQAHTPPASSTASSRRGLPGFAAVFGDSKRDAKDNAAASVVNGSGDGSLSLSSRNRSASTGAAGVASPPPPPTQAPTPGLKKSYTLDDLDDAEEDDATPRAADGGGRTSAPGSARAATAAPLAAHNRGPRVSDNTSLDSGEGVGNGGRSSGGNASASARQPPPPVKAPSTAQAGVKTTPSPKPGGALTIATTAKTAATPPPPASSPLTALAVFNSTDEPRAVKSSPLTAPKVTAAAAPVKAVEVGEKIGLPVAAAAAAAAAPSKPAPAATPAYANGGNTVGGGAKPVGSTSPQQPPPFPPPPPPHATTGSAGRPGPLPSTSPPSLVTPAAHSQSPQQQQRRGSALRRDGRYAMSRSRDSQGPLSAEHDDHHHTGGASGVSPLVAADVDAEAATLNTYLKEEELNLSMSTFNSVGLTLAQSLNLRVLNLKGSTIASEGLRGLANIATLRSICVSHMRHLSTLIPLVTPTSPGVRCAIEEIDAQFSGVNNDGIRDLEKVRRLRRLDLSMTPVSDVTCLAGSISLQDLYLTGTRVDSAGVAGLEKVPTLTTLNIARTKVASVAQLAKSRSLQTFILYSCQVNDAGFTGVADMPRLATLDVSTTKIENLSVLQRSRSLRSVKAQWLSLKNCQDIIQERRSQMDAPPSGDSMEWRDTEAGFAGLAAIATLDTLDLSFNTLRSVHSLCRSKSLKHLFLKRTRVENSGIGSIAQLAATLETLVITNLTDSLDDEDEEHEFEPNASGLLSLIGDIHLLQHLTLLDLSYTDVFDLRLLQNIDTLKELVIVETLVTVDGLRGIEKIPSLEVLDVSQTSILSLQFLVGGAPRLKKIFARSNRNTCGFVLGQIHRLPALEHLDLSDSVVEDMETVPKKSWRLKELVWRWGERRDNKGLAPSLECWVTSPRLVGLREMPCLSLLDLTSSRVHELAFLAGALHLKTVYLRLCKLLRNGTVQELGSLASLEELQLSDNTHITDVTFLRGCRHLRELHLNNTRVTTKGLEGVLNLPELKVLNIANTRAEDETMNGGRATERNRMLEDSMMRDGSAVLDSAATPAQFRVPRRRRVSFVANDGADSAPKAA